MRESKRMREGERKRGRDQMEGGEKKDICGERAKVKRVVKRRREKKDKRERHRRMITN